MQTISSCKYLLLTGHFLGFLFLNQFPHYRPWSTAGQFKFFPLIAIIHCEALHRPCPQAKNRLDRQTLHHLSFFKLPHQLHCHSCFGTVSFIIRISLSLFNALMLYTRQLQMFQKVEYGEGPIFKVVLAC